MCKTRKGDLLLYSVLRKVHILRRRPAYAGIAIAAWPRTATSATEDGDIDSDSDEEDADEEIADDGSYLRLNGLDLSVRVYRALIAGDPSCLHTDSDNHTVASVVHQD
jgi:hypothetical protein